jgi:putative DNA methylase
MLSTKAGKEAYVEPVVEDGGYRFTVKVGTPKDAEAAKNGTKLSRGANFQCLMSTTPISGDYIKAEGTAGRIGARLMAIVAEGNRGRVYLAPTPEMEAIALTAQPTWRPETPLPDDPRNFWTPAYGLTTYGDLFTPRQLVALTTFSDLVKEARERVKTDALAAESVDETIPLCEGGGGAGAYADSVAVYLGMSTSKLADAQSTLCRWKSSMDQSIATFARQALPMTWDYSEANALGGMAGDPLTTLRNMMRVLDDLPTKIQGSALQKDSQALQLTSSCVVSTDPPYYDNISYADLSDFFYVWLRLVLKGRYPAIFGAEYTPKSLEAVANRAREPEDPDGFYQRLLTLDGPFCPG